MPLPRGPRFPTFAGVRPGGAQKDSPVLGVGWRVLVTSGNGRSNGVTLTDETGTSTLATIAHGAEVEILAWRPRRGSGDTRYRVVATGGGVEGWLGAASLQPRPFPVVVKPVVAAAPPRALPSQKVAASKVLASKVLASKVLASAKSVVSPKSVVTPKATPPAAPQRTRQATVNHSPKATRRGTR